MRDPIIPGYLYSATAGNTNLLLLLPVAAAAILVCCCAAATRRRNHAHSRLARANATKPSVALPNQQKPPFVALSELPIELSELPPGVSPGRATAAFIEWKRARERSVDALPALQPPG